MVRVGVCLLALGNKGYVGEDISYRPSVIDYCLCEGDTMDAFGPRFAEVCMPGGVDIWATSSPPQKGQEVISTYPVVLTDSYGRQTFVACASFLDDVHPGQAIREHSRLCNPGIKARKAVCLCSRYPVVLTCLRLVRHLVELVLPRNGRAVPLFDAAKELVTKLPSPQPGSILISLFLFPRVYVGFFFLSLIKSPQGAFLSCGDHELS